MIKEVNGKYPQIDPSAFLAPSAEVLGDVVIGPQSSIWYQVVIRADINFIRIGGQTSIQDGTVLHVDVDEGRHVMVGDRCTVGHNVILHGCEVGSHCLIGMGAVVLSGARVGEWSIVGAGALVAPGKAIPSGVLAVGKPARVVRSLTEAEYTRIKRAADSYLVNMATHRDPEGGAGAAREA